MTTWLCHKTGFLKNNKWSFLIQTIVAFVILFLMKRLLKGYFGLGLATQFFPYFAIGAIMRTYFNIQTVCKKKYMLIWGVLFVSMAPFWYRMPNKVPSDAYDFVNYLNTSGCYRFMTALSGCMFLFTLFHNYLGQKLPLSTLGRKTLSIYIFNFPIIWLASFIPGIDFHGNIWLSASFLPVLTVIALSVDSLIKRIPVVKTLILGYPMG